MKNYFILLTLAAAGLNAQSQIGQPATQRPVAPEPLTVKEKLKLSIQRSFDPAELIRSALGAGFSQWRGYPSEWGQGLDAYGVRVASDFGQNLVKQEIEFGVEAIDHEDPRRSRSGLKGIWPRTRYAVVNTFTRPRDNGGRMIAYSRFIGDYGVGFVSREWYPDHFHTVAEGLKAGTVSLGLDVGMNVLREFWPHRRR